MKKTLSIFLIIAIMVGCIPIVLADNSTEMGKGVSIMCVGESTTYGNGTVSAYRGHLYRMYKEAGIKANFIGPISDKNDDLPIGSGHGGIGGLYITEIAQRINPWLECYQPQVVYLTIGGNDTSQGKADKFPNDTRETAPDRLKALVQQILNQHPTVELYVASITPSNSGYNKYRTAYNEAIEPIVNEIGKTYSNVHFVDVYDSITDYSTDLQSDGLHPTEAGYAKMAKTWFDATKDKISSMPVTAPLRLLCTPRTGVYMAQLESNGESSYSSISQSKAATVDANTDYIATFHLKGSNGVTALLKVNTTVNGAWKQVASLGATPGPNWSTYTINFNTGDYTSVFLAVQDNSKVAGTVYFDDFSLVKADDETQTNLVLNPSFEDQKSNWSLNSLYSIVRSKEIVDPPTSIEKDLDIIDSLVMDFEELASDNRPNDIDCSSYNGNSAYYTSPYSTTDDYVSSKAGMFYVDTDGHRYILLNPKNSYQTSKFIYTRGGYQNITGFDEMRIKMKMVTRTDGSVDYTGKTPANYPLKITLNDLVNSSTTAKSSAEVFINTTQFNVTETVTIKNSQFKGGTLDIDGQLTKYTDTDGKHHQVQMTLLPKGGVAVMIDEIEFIWYEEDNTLEYKSIAFKNDGTSVNAMGIMEGTTTVYATLYNARENAYNNAFFCVALYNKSTDTIDDVDLTIFDASAKETLNNISASVTLNEGKNPSEYIIKVFLWENSLSLSPITNPLEFDTNGAVGQ